MKFNTLLSSVINIETRLSSIENSKNQNCPIFTTNTIEEPVDYEKLLPLDCLNKFEEFEKKLCDPEFFNAMVSLMKYTGGKDFNELTHNILKKFVSNKVAIHFNMDGKHLKRKDLEGKDPKRPFGKSRLYLCLMTAVRQKYRNDASFDEASVRRNSVAKWFAGAPQRLSREIEKEQKELGKTDVDQQE